MVAEPAVAEPVEATRQSVYMILVWILFFLKLSLQQRKYVMIKATNFRELSLSSADRLCWLADICYGREIACQGDVSSLIINIGNDIPRDKIRPEHVTSLACLIEYCTREGCDVNVNCSDEISITNLDFLDIGIRTQSTLSQATMIF